MATDLENLQTRRSAILTELAAINSTQPGGKPDSTTTGVEHVAYKDSLYRELGEIDARLAAIQGPVEISSETTT